MLEIKANIIIHRQVRETSAFTASKSNLKQGSENKTKKRDRKPERHADTLQGSVRYKAARAVTENMPRKRGNHCQVLK